MKEKYIAPTLTVVSFAVEQGFYGSGGAGAPLNLSFFLYSLFDDESLNHASSYSDETSWSWDS